MGVKDLWNIIQPLNERRPLYELNGKAVAIDLSGWVVDSQTITSNHSNPKMYLRNLFFRTSIMLQQNIFPVFVLEGVAPNLKHKTIARRNEIRSDTQNKGTSKKNNRSQFNAILKQCEEMLKYMGLFCLRAEGEAEAMCAYLDQKGLVDGCISQDSDCFLYGAKKVYRNFCTKSQGPKSTSQGTVDVYTLEKIQNCLNIGRNKMIALALLCGCDYDEGVKGIGKEAALKLFENIDDAEILDRLKSWRSDSRKYERLEREINDPNVCNFCGHEGKMRSHLKKGCIDCGTDVKCKEIYKEKRAIINNELLMRKKALLVCNFPSQEIINEFLEVKEKELSSLLLEWKQPKVHKFIDFMNRYLSWESEYGFAKIFPLMTQWQLQNLPRLSLQDQKSLHFLIPKKICKIRKRKGVLSYEILWKDEDNFLAGLTLINTSEKENDGSDVEVSENELVSIESQETFAVCYPQLVEKFEESRAPKKKATKKRKAKGNAVNNRKIDEFIVKDPIQTLRDSMGNVCITPRITPKRQKRPEDKNSSKKRPQINRIFETEQQDIILNDSIQRIFNELAAEDCDSDDDEVKISNAIDRICASDSDDHNDFYMIEISDSDSERNKMNNEENGKTNEFVELNDEQLIINDIDTFCEINATYDKDKYVDLTNDNASYDIDKYKDLTNDDAYESSTARNEIPKIDLTLDDEFDINEVYVPLMERVHTTNTKINNNNRLTIGIDDLFNSTEESFGS